MYRTDGSDVEYCFITGGTDPKPVTNCYVGDSITNAAIGDTTVDTGETTSFSDLSGVTTASPENANSTNSGNTIASTEESITETDSTTANKGKQLLKNNPFIL
jgi:hypothetical protein